MLYSRALGSSPNIRFYVYGQAAMTAPERVTRPLSPERSLFLRQAAAQALEMLRRFSSDDVGFGPTALQVLDEWIDRIARRGPLSPTARILVIAFTGHTFIHAYGGYWVTEIQGEKQNLGVVCPIAGQEDRLRFINIVERVNRRLAFGVRDSLAFFFLTTSVDLRGRTRLPLEDSPLMDQ
jgi:hypothetical protein